MTAWANAFSLDEVFARQVQAHGQPGYVLFVISSSGQSPNLVKAIRAARKRGMFCIGLLGKEGGLAGELTDINIIISSNETARIQELQLHVIHVLSHLIERHIMADDRKIIRIPEEWSMDRVPIKGLPGKTINKRKI